MEDFLIQFENEPIPKPRNVKLAIILLVSVICVATLSLFSNLIFTDFYTFKEKIPNYLVSLAIFVFLAFHINARRNWARILYIVLLVIAMITIPSNIVRLMSVNKLSALILFVKTVMEVAAVVALLTKPSNKWFKARV
ncbi:MAG: hypothetical protein ACTHK0_19875 [Ginsengibacter sp.]